MGRGTWLLLIGLVFATSPLRAQHDWVPVIHGPELTISIDTASLTPVDAFLVSAWTQWTRERPVVVAGEHIHSGREYREYDCRWNRSRARGRFLVDSTGDMVDAARDPTDAWEEHPLESEHGELLRIVCLMASKL